MHFVIQKFYTLWELTGSRNNLTFATVVKVVCFLILCAIVLSVIRWMSESSGQSDRL